MDYDDTEVTESSWSNKKFVPVSGYWKGRHANGSTIRVEEKELRSKFGDAYVDQVKNMRCGFMDIPVGEYKVSQLHKYPHLRVLGAPTIFSAEGRICVRPSHWHPHYTDWVFSERRLSLMTLERDTWRKI